MEMRFLTVLDYNKSKGGVLEPHTRTIIDQSAVKIAVWNLRFKVAKHVYFTGRNLGNLLNLKLSQ